MGLPLIRSGSVRKSINVGTGRRRMLKYSKKYGLGMEGRFTKVLKTRSP